MQVSELQKALSLLTSVVEKRAAKVVVCSGDSLAAPDGKPFDFIGFATREMMVFAKDAPNHDVEIAELFKNLQSTIDLRMGKEPAICYWKDRPNLVFTESRIKIGCRVRFSPAVAKPELKIIRPTTALVGNA